MPTFDDACRQLSPMELKAVRQTFAAFDQNGDGHISLNEFRNAMQSIDPVRARKSKMLMRMFHDADQNGDKRVSWDEFIEISSTSYEELKRMVKSVSTRPPESIQRQQSGDEILLSLG